MIDKCKSCAADIYWLRHQATGKLAPIDAQPSANGNIVIEGDRYTVRPKDLLDQDERPRHTSHYATCPDAAKYRRTAKKSET